MNYTNKNSRILKTFSMKYYLHVLINNTSKMHILLALALALALICIGKYQNGNICIIHIGGGGNPEVPK